jgi:hypothetical protein
MSAPPPVAVLAADANTIRIGTVGTDPIIFKSCGGRRFPDRTIEPSG